MKQINRSALSKISNLSKNTARYQNLRFKPSPMPKPMNPYDNLDPTKIDQTVIDEYDQINRKFNKGDEAPLAWKARREFPDWYKPYLTNYFGHGYLIAFCAFFGLCYYIQLEETKKIKGRQELVYHHEDYKIPFKPFVGIFIRREILDNHSDSYINWLRRYIKESGF